jgi:hypothetical protein
VTALTFNAVWQYACRHRLLNQALGSSGATAIGRRFQLAVVWLMTGALLGVVFPVLGVAAIVAFNAYYWFPIRGESPRVQSPVRADLAEAAKISHQAASASCTGCPAAAMLARRLRRASNRFL